MSPTRGILSLIFGVIAVVGVITFIDGFAQLFLAELSAAYIPREVFFQRMNSATGLTGTGGLIAFVGGISFYLLLKTESTTRHHRRGS